LKINHIKFYNRKVTIVQSSILDFQTKKAELPLLKNAKGDWKKPTVLRLLFQHVTTSIFIYLKAIFSLAQEGAPMLGRSGC